MSNALGTSERLEAVLEHADRGWPVLPLFEPNEDGSCSCGKAGCESPGKHPRTKWGLKDASTDRNTIAKWWRKWPAANIGVCTGQSSGLLVLDVDGKEGEESLRKLGYQLPPTWTVRTGSGWHYLFRHPGGTCPNTSRRLGRGLDTRGDGGYIVAPGSHHSNGRLYEWTVSSIDAVLADAPPWLLEASTGPGEEEVRGDTSGGVIPKGRRNDTLASLAGMMRRRGMSADAIEAALLVENGRCDPPLSEDEVQRIARSIARYRPDSSCSFEVSGGSRLVPYGVEEILSYRAVDVDWYVENVIGPEVLTVLAAKPKAGKTTLALGAVSAMDRSLPFIGFPTRRVPVLYVSEQNLRTVGAQFRNYSFNTDVLTTLFPTYSPDLTWGEIVSQAEENAAERGCRVIVFDTLNSLARVEDENAAPEMLRATAPLKALAAHGYAVFVCVHARKGAAQIVDATRGSNALVGEADVVLLLESHGAKRTIESISRDHSFEKMTIVREGREYVAEATPTAAKKQNRMNQVRQVLEDSSEPLGVTEICSRTKLSDPVVREVLAHLEEMGHLNIQTVGSHNKKVYSVKEGNA